MNEQRTEAGKPSTFPSFRGSILTRILVVVLIVFLAFSIMVSFAAPFEVIYALAAGWVIHGLRVVPDFLAKWQVALLPAGALALAWIIGHRLIRWWLAARSHQAAGTWTMARSGVVLGLVMLCGTAAIAFSGLAHQMMWLAQTKWTERSGRTRLTMTVNNARQLMLALYEFDHYHDRLPRSWDELLNSDEFVHREHLARLLLGMNREVSWFSLTLPGAEMQSMNPATIVLVSDLVDGYHVIGRADASVTRISPLKLDSMIARGEWLVEN